MKIKPFLFSVFAVLLISISVSCSSDISEPNKPEQKESAYGSLTICTQENGSRYINASEIEKACVTVSGYGMKDIVRDEVDVKNGSGTVTIENIPVGKNRVVTVQAKKTISNVLSNMDGVIIRAVTDISAGNGNSVYVNWSSTACGNVFYELIKAADYDVSSLSKEKVTSYLPENTHASLTDTNSLAKDIKSGKAINPSDYILEGGTVTFSTSISDSEITAHVNDTVSAKITLSSSGEKTIIGIAPGSRTFYIIKNGTILFQKTISVEEGQRTPLGEIKFSVPAPRLETSDGKSASLFIPQGNTKTVYLACRTLDGETQAEATIYYTTDGTEPTTESTVYTSSGIEVSAGMTLKAFAVQSGLTASDVVSYEFQEAELGFMHPETGKYSPVNKSSWSGGTWNYGAETNGSTTTFALYSKNAEKVLLEIYGSAYGEDAQYDYWLVKDSNDVWRAKISGDLKGAIYAFRLWGPNWKYSSNWKRGGSSEGFISDCDSNGNRFNPNKVVFDPYAKEITHDPSNKDALLHSPSTEKPYNALSTGENYRNYDSGKIAPKGYIITDSTSYGTKPEIPQKDAIIYEAHVRGITNHSSSTSLSSILSTYSQFADVQDIPAEYRGTYKGASYLVPYLKALGINTIELLPVHETDNDANPDDGPGGNFWGYMTFDYFAPDRRYSYDKTAGGPTKEFKEMVKAFHDAGMEVYLDVVYNHSGEGGPWNGKTDNNQQVTVVSMRGIDNSTYYSLVPSDKSAYWETTGCGNNLQCDNPYVRNFILDSLEYWIDEMGVDGFRFDLATVLGREYSSSSSSWDYNLNAETTVKIAELGKAKNVEMIAESWDCGNGSYQVGNFPDGWAGWNGYYRDNIRGFVGNGAAQSSISYTDGLYGTLTYFGENEPSVNFVVAHDGFTLADLCSYQGAGNALNGKLTWPFGPSDGGNGDTNNLGTGTDAASNRQRARNYFAMQMFSAGIPMIVYGDEFGRTQNGNNNPYNIDSVATWNNYSMIATDSPHTVSTGSNGNAECGTYTDKFGKFENTECKNGNFDFARFVMNERLNNESLRQVTGAASPIEWYSTAGVKGWADEGCTKALMINGSGKVSGGTYYMMINMTGDSVTFTIPAPSSGKEWTRIVDTGSWAEEYLNYWEETDTSYRRDSSDTYGVGAYTVTILKQVTDTPSCSTPVISGTSPFDTSTQITITCDTDGAKIYYTVDDSVPSEENGKLYTGAFIVTEKTSVKAVAVLDGYKTSSVASKTFYVKGQVSESSKSGVMLQGFTWNSAPRGTSWNKENPSPYWGKWYGIMKNNASAIKDTFEYVWFNPPSICDSASSEGYAPTELNNLNSYYGTEAELKEVIQAIQPAKAIADIVVNHRAGSTCWGDFTNPSWGVEKGVKYPAICSDDEGFDASSGDKDHMVGKPSGAADTGASYSAYRDLDHTNTNVQEGIIAWMNDVLKPAGFVGWRYDYVKGFAGKYVGKYNAGSSAQFSVGEYWPTAGYNASSPSAWGNEIKNWITSTEEESGQRSRAFDFALKGAMNSVFGWGTTAGSGNYALLADSSNLYISQPSDAVTFIDNHDTGSNQGHWELNRDKIGAGYALILTHPGVPCVSWSHYFTFSEGGNGDTTYPYSGLGAAQSYIAGNTVSGTNKTLREHIYYLIQLRKEIGIEYDSVRTTLKAESSVYAAEITGTNGSLIVSIGGSYTPTGTGYAGNNPIYGGTNFRIWQKGVNGTYESGGETTVEISVTVDDWAWNGSVKIFAWVWTNGLSNGSWVQCSGSGTTVKLELPSDCDRFLLVRCPAGTTQPNWDATGDTPGKVYNKTPDISYVNGTTSYSANFGNP